MFLSMAIAAIALGGFSASAKDKKSDNKDGKPVCTELAAGKCDAKPNRPCPFEGLNLTDAQKEQLKQLRQAAPADKQARKEAKREAKREARRERLAKVKAILTPEQYVQYLENLVVNRQKMAQRKPGQKHAGEFRQGRRPQGQAPQGGPRPERAPRQQQQQANQ